MTKTADPQQFDSRRRRILYRATHRGTKESDAIVGGYFTRVAASLPDTKLDEADEFLAVSDLDILDWLMGRKPVPERWKNSLYNDLIAFYEALGREN
jgi:antitoxin CptB